MNAEEQLVLEQSFEYIRHDGSRIALAVAVLALIGDHRALNPLLALMCRHCRYCMWPRLGRCLRYIDGHVVKLRPTGFSQQLGSLFTLHYEHASKR